MLDYDGDRRVDLFLVGGGRFEDHAIQGRPSGLFRNLGEWRFEEATTSAGVLAVDPLYTHGAHAADANEDGFPDILVTGYGGVRLLQNQGDGTFVESRVAAGLNDAHWSSSAAWGDLNGEIGRAHV